MTASAPGSGTTGLGDVSFEDLGDIEVSQSGRTIRVTGTLSKVEWPEFSSQQADLTGYYVAILLSGAGYVGKTTRGGSWKVVDVARCSDGLVVAVEKGQKSFTFQLFASKGQAEERSGGTTYTVDLSGVEYGEE